MSWFKRWYGANPLHLLTMIGCFALAWYAGAGLLHAKAVGVVVWFAGAVVGHDLILMPLYALADKSAVVVFRHRPPKLPTVPWINYLRVPVVLSGLLLLIWFPLIFRIPSRFPRTTDLSLDPYLGHWLVVTGALFLLSAVALAVRFRRLRTDASGQPAPTHSGEVADIPQHPAPGYPERVRYLEWQSRNSGPPGYPEQPSYPGQPRYPDQSRSPEQQPRYPGPPRYSGQRQDSRDERKPAPPDWW